MHVANGHCWKMVPVVIVTIIAFGKWHKIFLANYKVQQYKTKAIPILLKTLN